MNCLKCGTPNIEGVKFCVRCGNPFVNAQGQTVNPPENQINGNLGASYSNIAGTNSNQGSYPNIAGTTLNQGSYSNTTEVLNKNTNYSNVDTGVQSGLNEGILKKPNNSFSIMEYLFILLAVLLKPYTAFKEELHKFNDFKKPLIASCLISLITTIATLIKTILSVVIVRTIDIKNGGYTNVWTWENLKSIPYVQVIFKNFLIYLGIIVVITSVYYIIGLIAKKQLNFVRLFSISAFSSVSMFLCVFILSPIASSMSSTLGLFISIIGIVYTLVITYEMMNQEIMLDGNVKIYFNLICLSILAIATYYLYMKFFAITLGSVGDVGNNIKDILNQFGY